MQVTHSKCYSLLPSEPGSLRALINLCTKKPWSVQCLESGAYWCRYLPDSQLLHSRSKLYQGQSLPLCKTRHISSQESLRGAGDLNEIYLTSNRAQDQPRLQPPRQGMEDMTDTRPFTAVEDKYIELCIKGLTRTGVFLGKGSLQ